MLFVSAGHIESRPSTIPTEEQSCKVLARHVLCPVVTTKKICKIMSLYTFTVRTWMQTKPKHGSILRPPVKSSCEQALQVPIKDSSTSTELCVVITVGCAASDHALQHRVFRCSTSVVQPTAYIAFQGQTSINIYRELAARRPLLQARLPTVMRCCEAGDFAQY